MDWKSAPDSEIVCYCRNVDKGRILKAVSEGASTLKEVMERTGAGKSGECAVKHPGRSAATWTSSGYWTCMGEKRKTGKAGAAEENPDKPGGLE